MSSTTSPIYPPATASSPALTGTPTAPTAAPGTNTTQIANTAYGVDAVITAVSSLYKGKGGLDCSGNPNYPASATAYESYSVTVAGKIGGASGRPVDIGDLIVSAAANAGGTQAAVGASWFILEHNLVGALMSANNLSDLASASTARTNLGLGTLATQSGTFSGTSSGTNTGDLAARPVRSVTGNGNITDADQGYILECSGAGITLTLSGLTSAFQDCEIIQLSAHQTTIAGTFTGDYGSTKTQAVAGTRTYIERVSGGTAYFKGEVG